MLGLGLGLVWAGEIYWYQFASVRALPRVVTPVSLPADAPAGWTGLAQLPALEHYQAISLRPLFHGNRQPEAVAAPVVAPVTTDLKTLVRLQGILLQGNQRVALFEWLATHQVRILREGEFLEGWRLEQLHASGAELSQGDSRLQFEVRPVAGAPVAKVVQPASGSAAVPLRQDRRR